MQPYKAYEMLFEALNNKDFGLADFILHQELPFIPQPRQRRTYSNRRKLNLFIRDGFTDRYILTWYTITSKSSLNTNNINSEYIS
ncbi:MAG: hypothetical protein ACTTJW_01205 [Sphaerochaeta sp.]